MSMQHSHLLGRGFPIRQSGLVLVTSLLLLVVVTILAIGMFRSFGVDEKIAGNVREKQRALNAAETAEQFAETWLSQGKGTSAVSCTTSVAAIQGQVCNQTPQQLGLNPAVVPWQVGGVNVGVDYLPATPTLMNIAGSGQGNYVTWPSFYITNLGSATVNRITTTFYQIDAVGYAGDANTAAVVEATYSTTSGVPCFSC